MYFFTLFPRFNNNNYNKWNGACDNDNFLSHGTYRWQNNKKFPFNKNNVATIKTNKIFTKALLLEPTE